MLRDLVHLKYKYKTNMVDSLSTSARSITITSGSDDET